MRTEYIMDISIVSMAFGTECGDERWNETADLNKDEVINILGISTIVLDFGKTV